MRMVQSGGHFIGLNPANNYFGHGFYQFGPELLFRVFSASNGFNVQRLIVSELGQPKWFQVADPAKLGGRVSLINYRKTNLLLMARRVGDVPSALATPQQSDYVQTWKEEPRLSSHRSVLRSVVKRLVPGVLREKYRFYRQYYFWKWNSACFQPLPYGNQAKCDR